MFSHSCWLLAAKRNDKREVFVCDIEAAEQEGWKVTELQFDNVCCGDEACLADCRLFVLDQAAHYAFLKQLDALPFIDPDARRRLLAKPLWAR